MSNYGMQVFNRSGQAIFDSTRPMLKLIGEYEVSLGQETVIAPPIKSSERLIGWLKPTLNGAKWNFDVVLVVEDKRIIVRPKMSFNGETKKCRLIIGVY